MKDVDHASVERWLTGYKQAWEGRDAAAAGRLFTEHATYRETPFDPPLEGRGSIERYWAGAVSAQREVAFSFEVLACRGNEAVAHWHVRFKPPTGNQTIELDGIFRLQFASPELVGRFEEWWHLQG